MPEMISKLLRCLAAVGAAGTLSAVAMATPASAAGSFAVVSEATGVGGAQTAGTLLRLTPNALVSDAFSNAEPWPTAPVNGLLVRTSRCNGFTPAFLPIKEVRIPGVTGVQDIVVYYPGSTDVGYGTCSYRGLVNLTLTPAAGFPGGNRTQVVVITS